MTTTLSARRRVLRSNTTSEINEVLKEVEKYEFISERTKRRIEAAAIRREKILAKRNTTRS
jgi:ribosomal protein S21